VPKSLAPLLAPVFQQHRATAHNQYGDLYAISPMNPGHPSMPMGLQPGGYYQPMSSYPSMMHGGGMMSGGMMSGGMMPGGMMPGGMYSPSMMSMAS